MAKTGFRIVSPVASVFKMLRSAGRADVFAPEVKQFLKSTLKTCIQNTPARSLSLIKKAQKTQYQHRIDYIPSFHELLDPTLIVVSNGDQWMYAQTKWWRPDQWHLPDRIWSIYQELLTERERRLQMSRERFIAFRAQARFLYKKSWWQIGQSVGIEVPCSQEVKDAVSRRTKSQLLHGHRAQPQKGYAQVRGGKSIYSIVIYNPFLNEQTAYWPGNGEDILNDARKKHVATFEKKVEQKQIQTILKILRLLEV